MPLVIRLAKRVVRIKDRLEVAAVGSQRVQDALLLSVQLANPVVVSILEQVAKNRFLCRLLAGKDVREDVTFAGTD